MVREGKGFPKIGYKGRDTKQSIKRGMSKCQKEGKEKLLFTEKNNNIIFRMSVIFRMSFAHHLYCEVLTLPPLLLFSCKNKGKHCFWLINKILWIKSPPVVAYKSVAYKKSCKFAF